MKQSGFKKKQIVWARTKGHPWWPGIITKVLDTNEYAINFIGDDSHSILSSDNIFDFEEKYDELQTKSKSKKFKEAVLQAMEQVRKNQKESQKKLKQQSESEDEYKKGPKKRKIDKQPNTRISRNKKSQEIDSLSEIGDDKLPQPHSTKLDREFQDLLPLLIASQLNYEQIRLRLTPIIDTISQECKQGALITDVLSERKGSILNAVYMILKHQSEQNPDHFFQRDIQQQIQRLQELISNLKQGLLGQFFDPNTVIQDLSQCCSVPKTSKLYQFQQARMLQEVINKQQSSQQLQEQPQSQQEFIEDVQNNQKQQKKIKESKVSVKAEQKCSKIRQKVVDKEQFNIDIPIMIKKNNKKMEIVDVPLRRKVCFNMLKIVKNMNIEEEEAKQIVLKIEGNGRESDPSMKQKYGALMWYSLHHLDEIEKEELMRLLKEEDWSETWNKLIQPVDRDRVLSIQQK